MIWYYMYPSTEGVTDLPLYVVSIGLHELQPRIDRPAGHEYDQFFYNSNGSGHLEMNGQIYDLPEGSAFFIPAHMPHSYYPDGDVWDVRWMVPDGSALPELYRKFHLENGGVFMLQDESGLDRILNRMRMQLIEHPGYGNVLAAGEVYGFIIEFIYQTALYQREESKDIPYENQILALKEYIGNHFMYPITLDDLCKVVPVTHQHICRIFRETLGLRPMEYVNQVRIEMARQLLIYSDYSIKEVGEKCGFQNTNYFCKMFKKYENVTPLEYRNSVI
ncbi:MAG: AraC family transcriptional regulator [Eubacteriales bacterium]|nr:AraC family transcriptional regulator [Eubacteriales bacterium]